MPLFEERIAVIPGPTEKYRNLSKEDVVAALEIARIMFPVGREPAGQLVAPIDTSRLDEESVRDWLRGLGVQGRVRVVWIWDRNGIEIDYGDFATTFDDFWYPSSYDVWVISSDGKSILDMDHEEVFSLYRR
jgi:hypothetical protein